MNETDMGRFGVIIICGIVSGWLAGLVTRGSGFGLIGNMLSGIIGAFAGYYLLDAVGLVLFGGLIDVAIEGLAGAFATLALIGQIRR